MQFHSSQAQDQTISGGLAPLHYLDDQGRPTEEYPLNPNGSPQGIAGLCSRDGRHLAMMPHPERCTLSWQWPWAPRDFRPSLTPSPWLRMFKNAAAWCSNIQWYSFKSLVLSKMNLLNSVLHLFTKCDTWSVCIITSACYNTLLLEDCYGFLLTLYMFHRFICYIPFKSADIISVALLKIQKPNLLINKSIEKE